MDINDAKDICHPHQPRQHNPGRELTADIMRNYRAEIDRVCGMGWVDALRDVETAEINGRAYLRGMMDAEALRAQLMDARAAICKMILILDAKDE